jgi:hypothetical protein
MDIWICGLAVDVQSGGLGEWAGCLGTLLDSELAGRTLRIFFGHDPIHGVT